MDYQRLLFLFAVAMVITTTVALPKDTALMDGQLQKRGTPCKCHGYIGVYWFMLAGCPNGYGYNLSCPYFLGICCVKK
uniref:Pi/alpha-stichotoxin-Hmg5b n=2 Tax=Stichodactylidae TaxID=42825 RepID=BDSB2_HETMG